MIDRLLASPHYGERWAPALAGCRRLRRLRRQRQRRHRAALRLQVSRLRHPLAQRRQAARPFIVEQLAGDELVPRPWNNLTARADRDARRDRVSADGRRRTPPAAATQALASNQVVADTLKIVGSTLLGLTVGCAQCHDHRYDPIPQARLLSAPRRLRAGTRSLALAAARAAARLALPRRRPAEGRRHRGRGRRSCRAEVDGQDRQIRRGGAREGAREVPRAAAAKLRDALETPPSQADRRAEDAARDHIPA